MAGWFRDEGLISDSEPNVSAAENAGNPHYLPTARGAPRRSAATRSSCSTSGASSIGPARSMLTSRGSGYTGAQRAGAVRAGVRRDLRAARDAGRRAGAGRGRAPAASCAASRSIAPPRPCCASAGYGRHILHRTGHSLGETVHGNGVNMDDYETHDDRRLLAGHRLHHRAGRLLRRLRRPDGNQHGRRRRATRRSPGRCRPRFSALRS